MQILVFRSKRHHDFTINTKWSKSVTSQPSSATLYLPPLSGVFLVHDIHRLFACLPSNYPACPTENVVNENKLELTSIFIDETFTC